MPGPHSHGIISTRIRLCLACLALLPASRHATAGAWTPEAGGGSVAVGYQYSHVQQHLGPDGEKIDVGSIDARNYFLQVNYGVTDGFAVNISLPYVQKRYDGTRRHNVFDEDGHAHPSAEDNGDWHGEFQDFLAGAQFQMQWHGWAVTPYASYGYPSNDYEHFAHAAIGANQKKLEIGVEAGRLLPAPYDQFYIQVGYGHAFPEKFRHVDIDRSTLTLETGWLATERFTARAFLVGQKTHGGLDFPDDFAYLTQGSRTDDDVKLFNHHDQIQRVDFLEGGMSAAYMLSPRTSLFSSVLSTIWGENGHATDYSITLGISRAF